MARPETKLTPPKSQYSFDLIVEIGKLRYLKHRQISEIQEHFRKRGVEIPERSVENLCSVFLYYLVAVHLESFPKIGMLLKQQGGYVLHIDGTTTKGQPEVLLLRDAWTGIRLLTASIPTEASDHIKPHLEMIRKHLGKPIAVIRDMGKGFEKAILNVFKKIYVITCHYHFLRSVGTYLFQKIYPSFRNRIDHTGIKKKLRKLKKSFKKRNETEERDKALKWLEYILSFKESGNGLAYPFFLGAMAFYARCEEIRPKIREIIMATAKVDKSSPCLSQLENALKLVKNPPKLRKRIHTDYIELVKRWKWFEIIREALRYKTGTVPLNHKGCLSDKQLQNGQKMIDKVLDMIEKFINNSKNENDNKLKKILKRVRTMILKRRDELFVPNISIKINNNIINRALPRTNNAAEQDFRHIRRLCRRIRGDSDVERLVQKDGIGMLILQNLKIVKYVKYLYGSLNNMVERFAKVSPESIKKSKALFKRVTYV